MNLRDELEAKRAVIEAKFKQAQIDVDAAQYNAQHAVLNHEGKLLMARKAEIELMMFDAGLEEADGGKKKGGGQQGHEKGK